MTHDNNTEIERRKAFRLDMEKELVDIKWTDENNQLHERKISCLDFSKGGVRLDCDHAIPVNSQVTVVFKQAATNSQTLHGKVIRCIQQENGWFEVALQLNEN